MEKQTSLIQACLVAMLLLANSARAVETTAVFNFENTPSNNHVGDNSVGQFTVWADEYTRDSSGVPQPRYAQFLIYNNGPDQLRITEIFLYDPGNMIAATAKQGSNVGPISGPNLQPVTVPDAILGVFVPTDTFVAIPGLSIYGIPVGGSWGLYHDLGSGVVEALESGTVRLGILVEGFDGGKTDTYCLSVPDGAGSTGTLLGVAMLVVEIVRRLNPIRRGTVAS